MRIPLVTSQLHRSVLLAILCLAMVGCASRDPAYIRELRKSVPDNGSPVAIRTSGPFGKPILRIAAHENTFAAVTEAASLDLYAIWTTMDFQTWAFRAYTPAIPSALLPYDRLYWFAKGRLQYQDGFNPPQDLSFPFEAKLSELIPNEEGLLAVAGTNAIYGRSEEGHWSQVATVPEVATLKSLTRTPEGICAVSSNTSHVWFWADLKAHPVPSTVPSTLIALAQVASTDTHVYLLTEKNLLEGDTRCGNWREISLPADTGKLYSIASGQRDVFLATQSGLYVFDGHSWQKSLTPLSRAATRRLRAIDGVLYASHSGGLEESRDLGQSWMPSAEPVGIGVLVGGVEKYRNQYFAVTDSGLYSRPDSTSNWSFVKLPAGAPTALRMIASAGDNYLVIAGQGAPDKKYRMTILNSTTGQWVPGTDGLEEIHVLGRLEAVRGQVYALTDIGLFWLDSKTLKWIGDGFNSQFGSVTALAAFKKRGLIVATGAHDLWYTEEALGPTRSWQRLGDTSFMKGSPQPPIDDIWSDTKGTDVFITSWNQLLCFRDGRFVYANHPDYYEGFSFASVTSDDNDYLFVGSESGVAYVDRRQTQLFSLAQLQMLYQKYSGEFWFWPIGVIAVFVGSYLAALICVLVLLYLPIPRGLIGSNWLITQIAKSLTISPLLGRWILFIGYEDRLRKRLAADFPVENAHEYTFLQNASLGTAQGANRLPLGVQLARSLSAKRFILVEHGAFEPLPEYFALACCGNDSLGDTFSAVIPVLIASSDWRDSIVTSASNVLRNHYSVPLDASDMLIGQMEKGDLVFIVRGLDKLGEKLASVLDDIQRTMDTESFSKCYVVGCCVSATDPLLGSSPALCRVVVTRDSNLHEVP